MKVWIVTRDGRPHEVFSSEDKAITHCLLERFHDNKEHNGVERQIFAVVEREVR